MEEVFFLLMKVGVVGSACEPDENPSEERERRGACCKAAG